MAESTAEERLLSGYAGRLFVVVTLGLGVIKAGTFLIPPFLPRIVEDLSITPFEAGLALSAMTICSALMQYPSGRLSDRLSRKTVIVASVALVVVGFALLTATPAYAAFVAAVAVVGAGDGFYGPATRAMLSDLFTRRRGQAFGVHMAFIDIGGVTAAAVSVVALATVTWRETFLLTVAPLVAVILLVHRWNRDPYVVARVPMGVRETGLRLLSNVRTRRLVVAYALFVFTWRGVMSFLPAFLQAEHGFSPAAASLTFAGLFAAGIVAKPTAGRLSDRASRPVVGAVALAIATLGIGLLVLAPVAGAAVAGVLVYAVGHKAYGPVMQAYLMDLFPAESMGGDLGAVRTLYAGFSSLGPAYVGFIAGGAGYTPAFAGLAVSLVGAAGITLWLARAG